MSTSQATEDEIYALRRIARDGFMSVLRPVSCDLYTLAANGWIRDHIEAREPDRMVTLTNEDRAVLAAANSQ